MQKMFLPKILTAEHAENAEAWNRKINAVSTFPFFVFGRRAYDLRRHRQECSPAVLRVLRELRVEIRFRLVEFH